MLGDEVKPLSGALAADGVPAPVADRPGSTAELIAARAILARTMIENIPSPCISVCRMSEQTNLCVGCYRTLDEIGRWSRADDQAKRTIWTHIEQRLAAKPS